MGQMYSIHNAQSPYPPIGPACFQEGCPVIVMGLTSDWTWTPQGDLWTLSVANADGNWTAVPNDFNTSVIISQDRSQNWRVDFSDQEHHSGTFNVSLPDNDLYWTITGTGKGNLLQLLGDGSDMPSWYQQWNRYPINH